MTQGTIGIDIGGVIIDKANDDQDTSLFQENYLMATEVVGAREAIKRLAGEKAFAQRIWIVSKCGEKIERRSREWLHHNGFAEFVPESRWRFCRDRSEKAAIAKELGLTHFVDDKLEVLHWMHGIVRNRILFRPWLGQMKNWMGKSTNGVQLWLDWNELATFLEVDAAAKEPSLSGMLSSIESAILWVEQRYRGTAEEATMAKLRETFKKAAGEIAFSELPWENAERLKDLFIEAHAFEAAATLRDLIMVKRKATEGKNA